LGGAIPRRPGKGVLVPDLLGLSSPEEPKPPPVVHEVVRVPLEEEGRDMEGPEHRQAARAVRIRFTTSPASAVVCLRNGDPRWLTLRAGPCRRQTAEGDLFLARASLRRGAPTCVILG